MKIPMERFRPRTQGILSISQISDPLHVNFLYNSFESIVGLVNHNLGFRFSDKPNDRSVDGFRGSIPSNPPILNNDQSLCELVTCWGGY